MTALEGYFQGQKAMQERDSGALAQVSAMQQLAERVRAANMDKQFRSELAALGPNPDQGALATLAARFAGPKEVLAREQGSLDRQATIQAAKESRAAALEQAKATAQQTHEFRMARLSSDADRQAEVARHNAEMERLKLLVAQTGQEKPPAGYRKTQDGNLEAIPGGPADTKLQGQFNADTATLQQSEAALDRLSSQVNLVKNSNLSRITGVTGMFPNIPGGAAANAQARLEALKYQIGFNVLQEMRNASKTNASGLGQITEKEHIYLQSQLGNLDKAQSEDEIRRVLNDIAKFAEESKARIRNAYNMKHPQQGAQPIPAAPSAPAAPVAPPSGTGWSIRPKGG